MRRPGDRGRSAIARWRPSAGWRLWPVIAVGLLLFGAGSAGEGTADVDATRAALEKWTETRRIISQERRDWALGREMLTSRIDVVKRQIESLREKIDDAEATAAEADRKRVDLGRYYSPPELTGPIRCDLHPRFNRDGTAICFDSAHEGTRQLYTLDFHEPRREQVQVGFSFR